jgi:hypothetical protein
VLELLDAQPGHRAVAACGMRAQHVEGHVDEPLLDLGEDDLVHRALETGVAVGDHLAHAAVALVLEHLDADEGLRERAPDLGRLDRRPAAARGAVRLLDDAIEQHAQDDLPPDAVPAALVRQRVHGGRPTAVQLAEQAVGRDAHVVEVDLAELRVPGHLGEWAHLDAGQGHVDEQVGDALVRLRLLVGPREDRTPLRMLRVGRPDLVPADDEAPVVLDPGDGLQRGEVRAGTDLGEALAPDVLCREDAVEEAGLLGLAAMVDQRRPDDVEANRSDDRRRAGLGVGLVDDDLLGEGRAAAAVLARPRQADEAGLVQRPLPRAQKCHAGGEVRGDVLRVRLVLGEEATHLVAEVDLSGVGGELHNVSLQWGCNS